MCAFFSRLPFDNSNAAITNKKIDQIPKSNFDKIRTRIKKFKNPNTVLENLCKVERIIGIMIFEVFPLCIANNFNKVKS
jgi:hypothetical protein